MKDDATMTGWLTVLQTDWELQHITKLRTHNNKNLEKPKQWSSFNLMQKKKNYFEKELLLKHLWVDTPKFAATYWINVPCFLISAATNVMQTVIQEKHDKTPSEIEKLATMLTVTQS